MNLRKGEANNSPMLAVDPTNSAFVAAAHRVDAPDFSCGLQISGDGGATWVASDPVPRLPEGVEKCYSPEVAFGSSGRLHYLFIGLAGRGNEPVGSFLTSSSNRGRTFSEPRRVLEPLNFAVRIAVEGSRDPDRIHLLWLHATSDPGIGAFGPPPNPIQTAFSDDGGKTFSKPVEVSDPDRKLVVAPALALGDDGRVFVAYFDLKEDLRDYHNLQGPIWEGTWDLVLHRSDDYGRSFGRALVIDPKIAPSSRPILIFTTPPPALAVSGKEKICAAWTDRRFSDPDVLLSCSQNSGAAFGRPLQVNDDTDKRTTDQYMPRLSFFRDRLDIVFYDRRRDRKNFRNDVYYAHSTDFGASVSPNRRITNQSFDTRIGPQYEGPSAEGQYDIGSRLGLVSQAKEAVAAWADTRNAPPILGTTRSQDIFSTRITLGSGKRTAVIPALFVVSLALLAISLRSAWTRRPRS